MNWKGSERKLSWFNRDTVPKFAWSDSRKSREHLARIADVLAEVRTEHILNASPEYYLLTSLFPETRQIIFDFC
jgi:hypothetical protein